jgi:chemotaxis protein histidine kinase CheA
VILNGTLEIESEPGQGTRLRARIPCGEAVPEPVSRL